MSDVVTAEVLRKFVAVAERRGRVDPLGYVLVAAPGLVTDEARALAPSLNITIQDAALWGVLAGGAG